MRGGGNAKPGGATVCMLRSVLMLLDLDILLPGKIQPTEPECKGSPTCLARSTPGPLVKGSAAGVTGSGRADGTQFL